eukprot:IDg5610t1
MNTRNGFSAHCIGLEARAPFYIELSMPPPARRTYHAKVKVTLLSTMSSVAKKKIGARVQARAHLALGEAESKRFYGSLYKETLVSGVLRVETEAGKEGEHLPHRRWNSLDGPRDKRISVRSVTLGDPPLTGDGAYSGPEQDEPPTPEPPLQTQTTYDAHGVVWSQREVLEPEMPTRILYGRIPSQPFDKDGAVDVGGAIEQGKTKRKLRGAAQVLGYPCLGNKASLWEAEGAVGCKCRNRLLSAPCFGTKTGMPRNRFEDIWSPWCSASKGERAADELSEKHRWRLVDDFVEAINHHRAANFVPSDLICVDESMSRWYGQGGHWIEHGLPQYVAIDRKPENGCEIQNSACGRSGVMMQLQLVTTADTRRSATVNERTGWVTA